MESNYGCLERRCRRGSFVEQVLTTFTSMMIGTSVLMGCATLCGASEKESRWVHPLCQQLPIDRNGPFINLADGTLMASDIDGMRTSNDDGKTWSKAHPVGEGVGTSPSLLSHIPVLQGVRCPASVYFQKTRSGVLVGVYLDTSTYLPLSPAIWDEEIDEPTAPCRLDVGAIRSLDGGKTWTDQQIVLDGMNSPFFALIQTRSGRLVAALPHLVSDPGRWVACSVTSDDDGKTWKRSHWIDLGGRGHHSGAMEPTVAELSDGRLLMLIRTHWGRFWEAFSEDEGLSWRTVRPSQIKCNSSPGHLLKLRSGRLVFVTNDAEGGAYFMEGRKRLFIRFSDDDAKTWTKPTLIASEKGGQLSYPYIHERRPGELWITVGFSFKKPWEDTVPLRLKVNEEEFLRAVRGKKKR